MGFLDWLFCRSKNETVVKVNKMDKKLSDADFDKLATDFGLKPAQVRAVFTVECGGRSGFLKDNPDIPVTLEEGHIFYKYGKQKKLDVEKIAKEYPTICYAKWTKEFYKSGISEYERYKLAATVDEECAMLATSWGVGQVMGFNYKVAGYTSVKDFVDKMYESEYYQLLAMLNFIKSNTKMYTALKEENWAEFARLYNGSGYAANKYDEKLKKAFDQYNK